MEIQHDRKSYKVELFEDSGLGCAGVDLIDLSSGAHERCGRITFWDASGQFFMELSAQEFPLEVIEKFISMAKKSVVVE